MLGTATKLQNTRNIKLQGAVSGDVNFDGSGNVTITTTQANIVIMSGDLRAGTDNVVLDYPPEFNAYNCVPLSCLAELKSGVLTAGNSFNALAAARGALAMSVSLMESNIQLNYKVTMSIDTASIIENDYTFRLILMKIF